MFPPSQRHHRRLCKTNCHILNRTAVRCFRLIWSFLICPRRPGKCGNTFRRPAAYRIHGPLYPSVVLTEPPGRARYGSLIMLRWFIADREAVPDLQTGFRSALYRASWRSPLMWLLITGLCLKNVYSVVKVHLVQRPRNNLVVTGISLFENLHLHRDARRPVLLENRPLYDPYGYFRFFMMSERIDCASVSCFWICKVSKDLPVSRKSVLTSK